MRTSHPFSRFLVSRIVSSVPFHFRRKYYPFAYKNNVAASIFRLNARLSQVVDAVILMLTDIRKKG